MESEFPRLFRATKTLATTPSWEERDSQNLVLLTPLEVDGVVVEGLRLRGAAIRSMQDENVCFQLEYFTTRTKAGGPLARVEWRPLRGHNNKGNGPKALRHKLITGSHLHCFEENWKQSPAHVMRGELRVALEINPDPSNFRELLALIGREFRISNVQQVPLPPWQPQLV